MKTETRDKRCNNPRYTQFPSVLKSSTTQIAAAFGRSTFDTHAKSTKRWGESQFVKRKKKCKKSRDLPAVSSREFNPWVVQLFEIECEKYNKQKKFRVHKNRRRLKIVRQILEPSKWNEFLKRHAYYYIYFVKFWKSKLFYKI